MPTTYPEPYSSSDEVPVIAKKEPPKQPQPKSTESGMQSIPDLKTGGPPAEETVELNGQEIVVDEKEGYSYDESIEYINNSDLFVNREQAMQSLSSLANLLKSNPDITLTIVGNTATSIPNGNVLYGSDERVYAQIGAINGKEATLGEVMLLRANRIYDLMLDLGVPSEQLESKKGSHRMWRRERTVTFVLKRPKN